VNGAAKIRRLTRRDFLKVTGESTVAWYVATHTGWIQRAVASIPGGSLDPASVPKFGTPLLIPPVMPRAGVMTRPGGKPIDVYEISMEQFVQQILPAGLPPTTVWGYGAVTSANRRGLLVHHAPSLTIESRWNRPVRVKWINGLKDQDGDYLPHLLPVDQTLHWANPPGGPGGRDMRPEFSSTPDAYTGPVPIVTHLHGASGVGDESDGYAEAWFLPHAGNIPAGYATEGTWYDFFAGKASSKFGVSWGPGYATFQYPNDQRESTLWYHDHTLGMTRLNVYAGPAGFFIVRGGPEGEKAVLDRRTGTTAILPGPAPREGDRFPSNKIYREISIAIQDRSFDATGSLYYPDTRAFFDGIEGPYIPFTDVSPIWNPEFFGNMIMVNGRTWPSLSVERRRYRFRFLNGCQSRFLILDFGEIPGAEVWQIGNEGGFLAAPVNLTADHGSRLLMGLAERADVIVDFTNVPTGQHVLMNVGPDEPFGGGVPGIDFEPADPDTTGRVMRFDVVPSATSDPTTPPMYLQLPPIQALTGGASRRLALLEELSEFTEPPEAFEDAPTEAHLGTVDGDPSEGPANWTAYGWDDEVTENPSVGDTEVWELYNATADAHPMHIHEVLFQVVDRQAIVVDEEDGSVEVAPGSEPSPPEPWEDGWKDTVIAYPGQVTRMRMRFEQAGQFAWHCHIVEHEDNEMMRPYRIGSVQPGQPETAP
jgi:FtsP/CotA-like multicopper oxidase with cupredoxin domain